MVAASRKSFDVCVCGFACACVSGFVFRKRFILPTKSSIFCLAHDTSKNTSYAIHVMDADVITVKEGARRGLLV